MITHVYRPCQLISLAIYTAVAESLMPNYVRLQCAMEIYGRLMACCGFQVLPQGSCRLTDDIMLQPHDFWHNHPPVFQMY